MCSRGCDLYHSVCLSVGDVLLQLHVQERRGGADGGGVGGVSDQSHQRGHHLDRGASDGEGRATPTPALPHGLYGGLLHSSHHLPQPAVRGKSTGKCLKYITCRLRW